MNIELGGKTAIVSGSTAGIGFAIAQGLAATGATVVVNGRTQAAVDAGGLVNIKGVHHRGVTLRGFAGDLGHRRRLRRAVRKPSRTTDILVNNLGIFGLHDFFEIPDDEWTRFFETNVMSRRAAVARVPAAG